MKPPFVFCHWVGDPEDWIALHSYEEEVHDMFYGVVIKCPADTGWDHKPGVETERHGLGNWTVRKYQTIEELLAAHWELFL